MTPTDHALVLTLDLVFGSLVFIFVLRILLRFSNSKSNSQIVFFIAKATNNLCTPISRFVPLNPRFDFSALIWVITLEAVYLALRGLLEGKEFGIIQQLVLVFANTLSAFLTAWFLTIIAEAILSFIRPVQTDRNLSFISDINRPILTPIRRFMPNMGGLDLSPIVALFIIKLSEILIIGWLKILAYQWV